MSWTRLLLSQASGNLLARKFFRFVQKYVVLYVQSKNGIVWGNFMHSYKPNLLTGTENYGRQFVLFEIGGFVRAVRKVLLDWLCAKWNRLCCWRTGCVLETLPFLATSNIGTLFNRQQQAMPFHEIVDESWFSRISNIWHSWVFSLPLIPCVFPSSPGGCARFLWRAR